MRKLERQHAESRVPPRCRGFDRRNLDELALESISAHSGIGTVSFARIAGASDLCGSCNFIDYVLLPPGTSIGEHLHGQDEEEFYLVLSGSGEMRRNGELFRVHAGDLIRNPPGGRHGLTNDGKEVLRIFVFEVSARLS